LTELKGWLGTHNAAVMTVLFLIFSFDLIAKGLGPLSTDWAAPPPPPPDRLRRST